MMISREQLSKDQKNALLRLELVMLELEHTETPTDLVYEIISKHPSVRNIIDAILKDLLEARAIARVYYRSYQELEKAIDATYKKTMVNKVVSND